MPKRKSENQLDYIVKKLKYLEKKGNRNKRSRPRRRRRISSSSSSNSSSSRSSSSRSSRSWESYDRALTEHGKRPQVRADSTEVPSRPQSLQRAPSPVPSTSKATDLVQLPVTSSQPLSSIPAPVTSPQSSTSRDDTAAMSQQQLMLPEAEAHMHHMTNTTTDTSLNTDILDILGIDPTTVVDHGPPINTEMANRHTYITTSGLKREEREEISNKYLVPENCQAITAPQLKRNTHRERARDGDGSIHLVSKFEVA